MTKYKVKIIDFGRVVDSFDGDIKKLKKWVKDNEGKYG